MPKRRKPVPAAAPAPEIAPDLALILAIMKAMQTYLEAILPKGEAGSAEVAGK